ncbi:hypothetical protein CsatB_010728 [Cannabis sativa]
MSDYVNESPLLVCPSFFKFKPTEEELIAHLNLKTMEMESDLDSCIAQIDHFCEWQPWELPPLSKMESNMEWWFLCRPNYKNRHNNRSNRTTKTGFWKKTGKERKTKGCNGRKRILVFHEGTSPGKRTNWVLHEYYSLQPDIAFSLQKPAYVICRLKLKNHENGQNEDAEKSPISEIENDVENLLESTTTTPVNCQDEVNNDVSSLQQQQLFSLEELCKEQQLFSPEELCNEIPKLSSDDIKEILSFLRFGETTNITYNSSNMRDSSKNSYLDSQVTNDTHTVGIEERVNHHRSLAVG